MMHGTGWTNLAEIQNSAVPICITDEAYEACGLPLYWGYDKLYVDNSNTNTLLYGAISSDTERFYTMSLLNTFSKAGETVVVVDSRDRIYSELQENFIINEYQILYITLKKDSVLECDALMMNWESAVQAGKKMAFFIRIEDADMHYPELDTLMNKVYESVKKKNSGRINFVFNNFSSLPAIQSLPKFLSDIRIKNVRFYLLGCEEHLLKAQYGTEAISIKNRCENWVFMNSRDIAFLREISELCGKSPLMSVEDLLRLKRNEVLVIHKNFCPYKANMLGWEEYCARTENLLFRNQLLDSLSKQFDLLFVDEETDSGENE